MPAGFPPEPALAAVVAASPRAGRRPRRPHRPPVRHARPGDLDRPRPGLRDRAGGRRHRAALRHRRRRVLRPAGRSPRPGGLASGRDRLPARRAGPPLPGSAVGGSGQPAARRAATGRRVHVRVDAAGDVRLDGVERAVVRSRAKLAYDTVDAGRPAGRLPRAGAAHRRGRGAARRATGRVPRAGAGAGRRQWVLRFAPRLESEDRNAGMSLATNLAVAGALLSRRTGLFRVMAEPGDGAVERLRHSAPAFGLAGRPTSRSPTSNDRCRRGDPRSAASCRRPPRRWRAPRAVRTPGDDRRGTRRWPRRTPMPPRRCGASPTATWSRRARHRQRTAGPRRRRRRRSPSCRR